MSRASRLLELLETLRSRRGPVTALDLARELQVSPRSIYRDVDALRSLGAPIDADAGVGFRLRSGFFLPPLTFSDDELDSIILGLGWVRQRADPALVRASQSALAKILSAKNGRFTPEVGAPALFTAASASERSDPLLASDLRKAIRQQRKLAVRYEDAQGSSSERIIWPIAVVYFDDVRVMAAWCERRSGFRHFRLDRITVMNALEERYPERRSVLFRRWREQDRDWRALLTVSDKAPR